MQVKIKKLHPNAVVPIYSSDGAACFDLYAATVNSYTIGDIVSPGHPVVCDTGLAFEIPPGFMMQVRSRSGLAFNNGITAFHGTIDSDFRGAVKVLLTCGYQDDNVPSAKINPGDRIAQAMIVPVEQAQFLVVDELTDTHRGDGGFGHTG